MAPTLQPPYHCKGEGGVEQGGDPCGRPDWRIRTPTQTHTPPHLGSQHKENHSLKWQRLVSHR